jgi:DNA repair protein RecN (Recombination protein N)
MLRALRIRNLAVIERVEIAFGDGFTVLTGETGAGKSILVDAVGLLLGDRASVDLVRTGETQAVIEATFEHQGADLVVRREIASSGRSRSFVNGRPATAGSLKDLARQLVELHGQHEHQALLDPLTHLPLLDDYAGLGDLTDNVRRRWETVAGLREQLDRASMDAREREARLELVTFQVSEIARVSPKPDEDEELAATRLVLANADRIARLCAESYSDLYDSDTAALSSLARVWRRVGDLAAIEPGFAAYAEMGDTVKSQLEDLASFIRDYARGIDAAPERLQAVEDRLASIERLKRKYGPGLDGVIARQASLAREQDLLARSGERADDVRRQLDEASGAFLERARALSGERRRAASRFATEVEALLADLAMTRTRFEVRVTAVDSSPGSWNASGIDEAELYLSPNPGEDLRPLARIVSGGELSRVMLALKTLGARRRAQQGPALAGEVRTLVFDEVDAGIGGAVADVVGARLRDLGRDFQVLCITHLPQIAARGAEHFRIAKVVQGGRTVTTVERLDDEARVGELARMMGGEAVTEPLLTGARELFRRAQTPPAAGATGAKGESESRGRGESETAGRRRRGSGG